MVTSSGPWLRVSSMRYVTAPRALPRICDVGMGSSALPTTSDRDDSARNISNHATESATVVCRLFGLTCLEDAIAQDVAVAVARLARRGGDTRSGQDLPVVASGVLHQFHFEWSFHHHHARLQVWSPPRGSAVVQPTTRRKQPSISTAGHTKPPRLGVGKIAFSDVVKSRHWEATPGNVLDRRRSCVAAKVAIGQRTRA